MLPAKLSFALLAASVLLAALHMLRMKVDYRWTAAFCIGLGTFAASQFAFAFLVEQLGLTRRSQMDAVIAGLRSEPPLLLVGSSFSARGLDGRILATRLNIDIGQLTYPGVFSLEQDVELNRYLAKYNVERIFIELGTELVSSINANGEPLHLTSGAILSSDPGHAWWSYRILLDRLDTMPFTKFAAHAVTRAQSLLANLTNTGFVHQMTRGDELSVHGYDPQSGRAPSNLTDEDVARGLANTDDRRHEVAGALAFRLWQRDRLLARGVKDVRFYEPPVADPERRAITRRLCEALGKSCVRLPEDVLLSLRPAMWRDMGHLNEEGADLYTRWFAEQLSAVQ